MPVKVSDFDYKLPEERIALFPPKKRGDSRLLVLHRKTGKIDHRKYSDLADVLSPGALMVINDTKVIKARLPARNSKGATRELLLLESHGGTIQDHVWRCLHKGKLRPGEVLSVAEQPLKVVSIESEGIALIQSRLSLMKIAEAYGEVPLPPYMKRHPENSDIDRYQTVFARHAGSVAAPTASLNLTPSLIARLNTEKIDVATLTLHVGLGTFLPIRTSKVEAHTMHSEYFEIPAETYTKIRIAKNDNKPIVAIGTTVARTLEFTARQLLDKADRPLQGEADIFIYPGYQFQMVDVLLTNFHAPHSTVLMLTAAFAGWGRLKRAYEEALKENYAFLSYGDSMLII